MCVVGALKTTFHEIFEILIQKMFDKRKFFSGLRAKEFPMVLSRLLVESPRVSLALKQHVWKVPNN